MDCNTYNDTELQNCHHTYIPCHCPQTTLHYTAIPPQRLPTFLKKLCGRRNCRW